MIRSSDLYFSRVVQLMIQDLRKNRFLINDILSDVTSDDMLKTLYGEKEVQKFNLLVDKEIQVNLEYSIDVAKLPAIAIRIGGGTEDSSRTGDALSDGFNLEDADTRSLGGVFKTPRIIMGPVTPINYDYITGKMTFAEPNKLTKVFEGMKVYDEVNKKQFDITAVEDDYTLYIEAGSRPNLNNMTIRSKTEIVKHIRKEFFTNETVTFICCSVDPVEVIYLYQLMMYLIGRNRLNFFETKNFRTTTLQYSPIYKLIEEPNLVFARDITLNGTIAHSYIEQTNNPIDGMSNKIKIADMKTPDAYLTVASNQMWDGEEDP